MTQFIEQTRGQPSGFIPRHSIFIKTLPSHYLNYLPRRFTLLRHYLLRSSASQSLATAAQWRRSAAQSLQRLLNGSSRLPGASSRVHSGSNRQHGRQKCFPMAPKQCAMLPAALLISRYDILTLPLKHL